MMKIHYELFHFFFIVCLNFSLLFSLLKVCELRNIYIFVLFVLFDCSPQPFVCFPLIQQEKKI